MYRNRYSDLTVAFDAFEAGLSSDDFNEVAANLGLTAIVDPNVLFQLLDVRGVERGKRLLILFSKKI